MKRFAISALTLISLACLAFTLPAFCQEEQVDIEALKKTAPKVFIDCGYCDINYIRTEITFVNYVRDRKEAHVHILVTTQSTGGGGSEYTIAFIGQNEFAGFNDTHKYFTNKTDTQDEIRQGLVKALKIGLMSYVAKTPISRRIAISYAEEKKEAEVVDKWNSWVFSVSAGGSFSGEKTYNYQSLRLSLSANRVTPEMKIQMSLSGYYSEENYNYEDLGLSYESTSDSLYYNGLFVKSLSEHWSAGAFLNASSSTYENIRYLISPAPAIEYNFFPYSQSTRRQLRCLYRLSYNSIRYREETIYGKTYENLWNESLSATLTLKEKWGTISTSLGGSHYFHDMKKYRLTIYTALSLNLLKGLQFFAFGGGSKIHDQLFLPRGEMSWEDILSQRQQLETSYSYYLSIGLSFTFGSIFTNVVNPRFGSEGYGGMSIVIY